MSAGWALLILIDAIFSQKAFLVRRLLEPLCQHVKSSVLSVAVVLASGAKRRPFQLFHLLCWLDAATRRTYAHSVLA